MKTKISCECGWNGEAKDLYHRDDCGEGWHCNQYECPECLTVIEITDSMQVEKDA